MAELPPGSWSDLGARGRGVLEVGTWGEGVDSGMERPQGAGLALQAAEAAPGPSSSQRSAPPGPHASEGPPGAHSCPDSVLGHRPRQGTCPPASEGGPQPPPPGARGLGVHWSRLLRVGHFLPGRFLKNAEGSHCRGFQGASRPLQYVSLSKSPELANMTLFGKRVFADVFKIPETTLDSPGGPSSDHKCPYQSKAGGCWRQKRAGRGEVVAAEVGGAPGAPTLAEAKPSPPLEPWEAAPRCRPLDGRPVTPRE